MANSSIVSCKPAPTIAPGTALQIELQATLLTETSYVLYLAKVNENGTLDDFEIDETLKDLVTNIEINGSDATYNSDGYVTFTCAANQASIQATITFGATPTQANPLKMLALGLAAGTINKSINNDKNLGKVSTLFNDGTQKLVNLYYQPVIFQSTPDVPTVISRKEGVPTRFTTNIARFEFIRNACESLRFPNYAKALDQLLCIGIGANSPYESLRTNANTTLKARSLPFTGNDAYVVLKAATEAYVLHCGAADFGIGRDNPLFSQLDSRAFNRSRAIGAIPTPNSPLTSAYNELSGDPKLIPYFQLVFSLLKDNAIKERIFPRFSPTEGKIQTTGPNDSKTCFGLLQDRMVRPLMVELIWSYWHEQALLVQTMYAIRNRVQNISANPGRDPLAHLEIGPLRPLNSLLWTYIQDEQHRLTISRRNFEYEHHYGLSLRGKGVHGAQAADRRSKFLEAFHRLLYLATTYFKEDDDTNRKADAFPVLHALKEVHFLLSEGAHNQFGDLPATSRIEMLMEQWLLARPEFQRFLPTRESIAYPEAWMGTVDAMKTAQGWTSTSVIYFNNLARFGEILLLSIRYESWGESTERDMAANWAKCFRDEIQNYVHSFRIVTGIDLSIEPAGIAAEERRVDPSVLIQRRWDEQRQAGLAQPTQTRVTAAPTTGFGAAQRIAQK